MQFYITNSKLFNLKNKILFLKVDFSILNYYFENFTISKNNLVLQYMI